MDDDVRTPKNGLEDFEFWMNDMRSQFITSPFTNAKKIEVKDHEDICAELDVTERCVDCTADYYDYIYDMYESLNEDIARGK